VILDEAQKVGADLIVIGNVRMQGAKRVLGAVANDVLHHAPCDVLLVKTV
jgi:nucleotide-binding universal stress UspA family protein